MAESLAFGRGKKRLPDKAYLFVTEERMFRTSWSNSSTSLSSLYARLMFLFVSLLSFAFGFSWAWIAAAIVVSRLSTSFSGFVLKWSLGLTMTTRVTFYTVSHFAVCDVRIVVWLSKNFLIWKFLKRARRWSLVLDDSIAYMGSWMLLPLMHSWFRKCHHVQIIETASILHLQWWWGACNHCC